MTRCNWKRITDMIKTFCLTPMIRILMRRRTNPENMKLSSVDKYRKTPKKIEASSAYTYDVASAKRAFRPRFPSWFGIAAISRRYAHVRARVCGARALRSCAYTCVRVYRTMRESIPRAGPSARRRSAMRPSVPHGRHLGNALTLK